MPAPNKKVIGAAGAALIAATVTIGLPFIKAEEGRRLVPYVDIVGVSTYCDGETMNVRLDHVYTDKECDAVTEKRFHQYAQAVYEMLNDQARASLTPDRLLAYTSLSYNVGLGAFSRSSVLADANDGAVVLSCGDFEKYMSVRTQLGSADDMRDGKKDGFKDCSIPENWKGPKGCKGIYTRRLNEKKSCLKGYAP